jgi:hypothetical protein
MKTRNIPCATTLVVIKKMKNILYILVLLLPSNIIFAQADSLKIDTLVDVNSLSENVSSGNIRIEIENKSFDKLVEKITKEERGEASIWTTLIPLLIGAGLTILTQLLIEFRRTYKENKNKKIEIKTEMARLTLLISDHYRELAMHKTHKFYWYAQFKCEENLKEPNKEEADKWYSSHVTSSNRVRETEVKIATSFSEYYKQINKLQFLTKFDNEIEVLIQEYQDFNPSKPKDMWSNIRAELSGQESEEEERLRTEYKKYSEIIGKINTKLN